MMNLGGSPRTTCRRAEPAGDEPQRHFAIAAESVLGDGEVEPQLTDVEFAQGGWVTWIGRY